MTNHRRGRPHPQRYAPRKRRRTPRSGAKAQTASRIVRKINPRIDPSLKTVFAAIGTPTSAPFVPDPFQTEAVAQIARSDCLVTAPTGAGKTWIAREAIQDIVSKGGRCWYTSPLKALSNSKYLEFGEYFGRERVGILTGDRRENSAAPVIVGTTEILRNQLYDAMSAGEALTVDLVVLDEAHYIGDPQRGVVWEEIIIYLPARITLLLLSATIGNARQLAGWLESVRQRPCRWIRATERPVPLVPLVLHPTGTLLPLETGKSKKKKKGRLHKGVQKLVTAKKPWTLKGPLGRPPFGQILRGLRKMKLAPAIFFLKSRKDCDMALTVCAREMAGDPGADPRRVQRLAALLDEQPFLGRHRHRRFLEHYGVGAHHSGHLPAWKLILETLMAEGLLQAIFATSTVAAGINVPARAVVFLNTDRFNGHEFAPLTATEFHQMTGRAGRRGMDKVGFVVGIPGRFMDLRAYGRLVRSPAGKITSQIQISFSMVLNLLLSHPPDQVEDLLTRSFAAYTLQHARTDGDPSGAPGRPAPQALLDSFRRHCRFLKQHGYIDPRGRPTADGVWAAHLRVDRPLLIAEAFRQGAMPEEDAALLAAVVASFVNEREYEQDDDVDSRLPDGLGEAFMAVWRAVRPLMRSLAQAGFGGPPLYLRPCVVVHHWARGAAWAETVDHARLAEGDLAMLILRTADNLRHIRGLHADFPRGARQAGAAMALIMREPVSPDYST